MEGNKLLSRWKQNAVQDECIFVTVGDARYQGLRRVSVGLWDLWDHLTPRATAAVSHQVPNVSLSTGVDNRFN